MQFIGKDIDFKNVVPVFVMVQNLEAPTEWEDGSNVFNILGMVFREGKVYTITFRNRFPSGTKQIFSVKKGSGYKTFEKAKKHLCGVGQLLVDNAPGTKIVEEHYHDIPADLHDEEGFLAFLKASDLFNIYPSQEEYDEAHE